MELKIICKRYQRNLENQDNVVYFEIDNKPFEINIIYFNSEKNGKRNVFLCDGAYKEIVDYVSQQYNISEKEFQKIFLRKLYKYSHGKGLNYEDLP